MRATNNHPKSNEFQTKNKTITAYYVKIDSNAC